MSGRCLCRLLAGDGNEYRARLLDGGLFLAPGRKARDLLTVYLQTMRPEARALCVARVGWHGDNFVLPGATIGPEGAGAVLFQTPFETDHYLNVSGTVDEWRDNVGRFCSGNSRLILAASCAFRRPRAVPGGRRIGRRPLRRRDIYRQEHGAIGGWLRGWVAAGEMASCNRGGPRRTGWKPSRSFTTI